ncbi:MAG: hypothetical protein QXE19_01790 [Candidatus Bathyarchaeia archaeon]
MIVFSTLIIVLIIAFLTPIIYKESSALEQFVYGYYLVADIVILSLLITGYMIFKGGKVSKSWLILILGLVVTFLADILFNLANSIDSEFYLNLGDLAYINGYCLITLGLIKHLIEL